MSVIADTPCKSPVSMNGAPACGAKTRKGSACKAVGIAPSGRCLRHGGKSLSGPEHPAFKDGKRSKHFYLPPILKARVEGIAVDIIQNLEDSVKTHVALETRLNEEFAEGCSIDRWRELNGAIQRFEKADAEGKGSPRDAIEAMTGLIRSGLNDAYHEERLAERLRLNHETQRKLSESVSKIRKEMQEVYTKEQWDAMLNVLFNLVVRIFASPNNDPVGTLYRELTALARPEPKQIGG